MQACTGGRAGSGVRAERGPGLTAVGCRNLPALQLYSHHVLTRLASDAEEAARAGAQHARTLPSFWAAKAALERQRQRGQRRRAASGGGSEEAGGEEGESGEARLRRKRARSAHPAEGGLAHGMELDGSEGEESLSSYRWATRQVDLVCTRQLLAGSLAAVLLCSDHQLPSLRPCSVPGSAFLAVPLAATWIAPPPRWPSWQTSLGRSSRPAAVRPMHASSESSTTS